MTIARRLVLLLAVPLVALLGLGVFTRFQLAKVEESSRFVAGTRIIALAVLGNLSRRFTELRVHVGSHLLATDEDQRAGSRRAFADDEREVNRLLQVYADRLVSSDQGRRLLGDYQSLSREWIAKAEEVMTLSDAGRHDEAAALLGSRVSEVGLATQRGLG